MRKDQGGKGGMVINTASIVGKLHVDRTTNTHHIHYKFDVFPIKS